MAFLEGILCFLAVLVVYTIVTRLLHRCMLNSRDNHSRYILITGCDTGFGHDLAKSLDEKGCRVIAGCLTDKGETDLRKSCSSRLNTVHMDVSEHGSIVKAFQTVKGFIPPGRGLWGVVNNAGINGKSGYIEWLTVDAYLEVFSVNLLGMIDVTTTFLPLVKLEKGRIVNMSSGNGRMATPITTPYCMSKFGVEAFSDGLRRQLREVGVSVHILEPGKFDTPLPTSENWRRFILRGWADSPIENKAEKEEKLEEFIRQTQALFESLPSQDPKLVVDAYEHALLGSFPLARYLVGADLAIFMRLLVLPEWVVDSLLDLAFKKYKRPYLD